MNVSRTVHAGLILVLAVSVLSCSKREDAVLAEFKDKVITVGDFEKAYSTVQIKFLPKVAGVEGYEEFLNTMVNKDVMAYKADELGYDKDPTVVEGLAAFKGMGLQVAYVKHTVDAMNKVTEEQIREHYRNRGARATISQILVDTPAEAEEVYQLLMDGADFETVLRQYSKGPDAEDGGKALDVKYGQYAPSLQRAIFSQPVGGITKPLWSMYGFFIIKVLKREDAGNKEPYEKIHDTLEQEVRVQNEILLQMEIIDGLMEKANTTWFWENMRTVFNALPPDRPLTNAPARSNEIYPLLYFEEDDLDKPIVSYKNKTITIKDFSDYYDQTSFFERPRRENRIAGIKLYLTHFLQKELLEDAIAESNIEENPEVKESIEAKREELMVSRLYADMISSQTIVTTRMIDSYYRDHKDLFQIPERRRFGIILTGDLETAQTAYDKLKNGARFRKVAMAHSIDEESLQNLAETELLTKGEQPEMDEAGFALKKVGDFTEPFKTSRGWMILKLTEKTEAGERPWNQIRDSIDRSLKQKENENRLNELLEKWREEYQVVIHKDNLSKIKVKERGISETL